MNMIMSIEATVFFDSVLLGLVLGVFFDVFRIIRIVVPPSKAVVFIQDILFFVIVAAASFYFFVTFNEGIVRGYLLLGELLGFIIYYCTIGSLVFKVAERIIGLLKIILKWVCNVISWPFLKIHKLILWIFNPIYVFLKKNVKKNIQNLKKLLLFKHDLLYNQIHKRNKHTGASKKRKSRKWLKSEERKKHLM